MSTQQLDVGAAFKQGILACRKNQWHEGYDLLMRVAQLAERRGNLPGVFYSYLGAAMARCEGRRRDGMELCRYALRLQPEQPENYLNLASVYLMLGRRAPALRAIADGLVLAPWHVRLLEMRDSLGVRQPPVFPFLPRSNPVNSLSGRVRARVRRLRQAARQRRDDKALFGE